MGSGNLTQMTLPNMWLIANLLLFLINNDQISSNQSGFKTGDSYVNQILSITHETY